MIKHEIRVEFSNSEALKTIIQKATSNKVRWVRF